MGEAVETILALVVIGGVVPLYVIASRRLKAQRGNRTVKRNHKERNAIRMSRLRGGSGGGMA